MLFSNTAIDNSSITGDFSRFALSNSISIEVGEQGEQLMPSVFQSSNHVLIYLLYLFIIYSMLLFLMALSQIVSKLQKSYQFLKMMTAPELFTVPRP